MEKEFTHFDEQGNAIMVDVSNKEITTREAIGKGSIELGAEAFGLVQRRKIKKGDVLGVARVAGIMAVKNTPSLLPLCHNLSITHCSIDFELEEKHNRITVFCKVKVNGKTGVEMEAMTGVSVALLTIYDMCKAVGKEMEISQIKLVKKTGGKSDVKKDR